MKKLTSSFAKKIQKRDKKSYDVDNKSEISFKACCPLISYNECSSTYRF